MKRLLFVFAMMVLVAGAQNPPTPTDPSKANNPDVAAPANTPASSTGAGVQPQSVLPAATNNVDAGSPKVNEMPQTKAVANIDELLAPPPMPKGRIALIGGLVHDVDPIRNKLSIDIFGKGGKMKLLFDERTHFYRNGVETTILGVHKGERVYVDTQLDKGRVFARNVQVTTKMDSAVISGQLVEFDARRNLLVMRDPLSTKLVSMKLTPSTTVTQRGQAASTQLLQPDSLVALTFVPGTGKSQVKSVDVLAEPGTTFKFYGTISHVDLRQGLLAIENKVDNKTYEIYFSPAMTADNLSVGNEASIAAKFSGRGYDAQSIEVTKTVQNMPPDEKQK